jgi:glycosyltransferase involved in cell wall biosynthesis
MRLRRRRPRAERPVARIAFNMRPVQGPWGGGNAFLLQLVRHLEATGFVVRFDLQEPVDCIVALDPRVGGAVAFGAEEIGEARTHTGALCVHRINENDAHRGGGTLDEQLAGLNAVADYTIFVSGWLRDYHAERWFDRSRPHEVIEPGSDPAVFHPVGGERWSPGAPLRLVTHHWSDNPLKGFPVYAELDRLIATGELDDAELWVIGRWPEEIAWSAARTWPPTAGQELGDLLRRAHVYVTGARWEPSGNHVIEGLQCGLPLLYHEDGGGIVELGGPFGIGYRDDVAAAVRAVRERYQELRQRVLEHAPSGDLMCARYRRAIEKLLVRS